MRNIINIKLISLLGGLMFTICAHSQTPTTTDGQIWFDGEFNYTMNRLLLQNELSFQTLLWGGNSWYSLNTTPAAEYSISRYLDVIGGVPLSYTKQTHTLTSYEIRSMLGARAYFTPDRRIQTRLLFRWEYRWFYDGESGDWNKGNRFRLRAEVIIPLNKPSYFESNMWYLINDIETFFWKGSDISERYANKIRIRMGLGYRLSYKVRFEVIYIDQDSRNQIEDDFNAQSNIFRLRFKYYFK